MTEPNVAFRVFDSHHGSWRPFRGDLPGQLRLLTAQSASAGAGYVRIDRSCSLSLAPDSDLYLHVISGEIKLGECSSDAKAAHSGDALILAKGGNVSLEVIGHCHLFFVATSNPDWRDRLRLRA